ncbi:MAG TPA: BMP family ABC transporter substrate-binding protein [Mycobacteriales bacterium]|nr:BMP family ABC transporter substrate-binding protein [Mycobacteriales bacterium]
MGLAFDIGGKGDKSFNDAADRGLLKAQSQLGVKIKELSPNASGSDRDQLLKLLASTGYNPVVGVGFAYADAMKAVAPQFPKTSFVIIDSVVPAPNVRSETFAAEQGSYLVGAAAAMATKTHHIGYVEALKIDLLEAFRAGYEAGARKVDPTIKISTAVINGSNPFAAPDKAKEAALGQYDSGADVIYAVAGGSGTGVFDASVAENAKGKKTLAIGVDSDQYQTVAAPTNAVILTSALKRVDVGVFDAVQEFTTKGSLSGVVNFDLSANGVGYSTSNPIIAPYQAKIDALAVQIKSGAIKVPTKPTD